MGSVPLLPVWKPITFPWNAKHWNHGLIINEQGELRVPIEAHKAARKLQLITLLAEGQRRLHSLEEEDALLEENFCAMAPGEGRFAPY